MGISVVRLEVEKGERERVRGVCDLFANKTVAQCPQTN